MKKIPPAKPVGWSDFGRFIFSQREADPGYYVLFYLAQAGYSIDQLHRFVVAWCTFYNLGIAARASELQGAKFYAYLRGVYPVAKRASERRHFRGDAGMVAIDAWQKKWPKPEALAEYITSDVNNGDSSTVPHMGDIRLRCSGVAQMGDYFKWKWGDLTEVLRQRPVKFVGWEKHSPKVPQQGAQLIAEEQGWDPAIENVYALIVRGMRAHKVKSAYSTWRAFDVQDAETICCVYKQYRTGGYIPGIRTAKAAARLHHDGGNTRTGIDALHLLLENQTQKLFRDPATLNSILTGETVLSVTRLLEK